MVHLVVFLSHVARIHKALDAQEEAILARRLFGRCVREMCSCDCDFAAIQAAVEVAEEEAFERSDRRSPDDFQFRGSADGGS